MTAFISLTVDATNFSINDGAKILTDKLWEPHRAEEVAEAIIDQALGDGHDEGLIKLIEALVDKAPTEAR